MRRTAVGVPHERLAEENNGKGMPDLRGADDTTFATVLRETVDTLEAAKVDYALIGGIASAGFGRPRWTHDIDIFVKPEEAERALDALAEREFQVEKTDPTWLFKAFKQQVMVDIIFRSRGGFHLDTEMIDRSVRATFQGHTVRLLPPEDLLVIKAVVHDEAGPRHWHDALGIIAGNKDLDWDYLIRRARRAPRRVLSLLIYAHSLDMSVPNSAIDALYRSVYDS